VFRFGEPHRAVIEVPLGSFVKRELHAGAEVDFVSPVPCPFNYGHVTGTLGVDGDPVDAVILGPRIPLGAELECPLVAVVRFLDAGEQDHKLVLSDAPLTEAQRLLLKGFFTVYAQARSGLNVAKKRWGRTAYLGLEEG